MNKYLLTAVAAMFLLAGCSDDDNDNKATAEIKITSHVADGVIHNNDKITFSADVTITNTSVSKVDFYLRNEIVKTLFSPPYSFDITLSDMDPGDCSLVALVTTADNLQTRDEVQLKLKIRFKDKFKGGTVFKVDDDGMHGLIVASYDLEGTYRYGETTFYGATSMEDGRFNTDCFRNETDPEYAAVACLMYREGGFDDWYLPAKTEMEYLFMHSDIVEKVTERHYWTSTEYSENSAYDFDTYLILSNQWFKDYYRKVRPIKKF